MLDAHKKYHTVGLKNIHTTTNTIPRVKNTNSGIRSQIPNKYEERYEILSSRDRNMFSDTPETGREKYFLKSK